MIDFQKITQGLITVIDLFATKRYLVLGDSHSKVFKNPIFKIYYPFISFNVCDVGGATVSGLDNPNSKTNTLKIFRNNLACSKKLNKIIFLIGEVDTGFVIWYRAEKHSASINKMLQDSVNNYTKFLEEASSYGNLLIISAPLPTITDDNDWGEVANLRKEVKATQIERTNLTIKFNNIIENYCHSKGFDYLNLDNNSKDQNGLVKKLLLNKKISDHHYDTHTYAKLIIAGLNKLNSK